MILSVAGDYAKRKINESCLTDFSSFLFVAEAEEVERHCAEVKVATQCRSERCQKYRYNNTYQF